MSALSLKTDRRHRLRVWRRIPGSLLLCGWVYLGGGPVPAAAAAGDAVEGSANDACLSDALCRAHYQRARKLSKEGDFAGALSAYQAAYARREVPWLLLNVGRTQHKLGRPDAALMTYQHFQDTAGTLDAATASRLSEYRQQAVQEREALGRGSVQPPRSPAETPQKSLNGPPELTAPAGWTEDTEEPAPLPLIEAVLPQTPVLLPTTPPPGPAPKPSRTGLWVGLGIGGGLVLSSVALGSAALSQSNKLHSTPFVGEQPTEQVLLLQRRTQALGIASDVALTTGLVTLTGTLLVTFALRASGRKSPTGASPPLPANK